MTRRASEGEHPFWLTHLSDTEREVVRRGGYGTPSVLGTQPCVVVIDMQQSVVGLDAPILDQISSHPSGVGEAAWSAVHAAHTLVSAARSARIPIAYTKLVTPDYGDIRSGMYGARINRAAPARRDAADSAIVAQLTPQVGDLLIEKSFPSAFFGTTLSTLLLRRRVDSLILVGGTTSGCVRSTAVDGASRGYGIAVVAEATFDRIAISHAAALLDIWMKYGAVVGVDKMVMRIEKYARGEGLGCV